MAQNKDIIHLEVRGKTIFYLDKIWKDGVQFMPKDPKFVIKLISARNRLPFAQHIIQWINDANSGKNLEEYQNAKTEEDLIEIIRRDAKLKGLIEVKK